MHPEIVGDNKSINARSLTTFFNCISSIEDFNKTESLSLMQMIGEGSVGPEVTTMFTSFIKNKLDLLISPKDMLLKPGHESVLNTLKSNCHNGNQYEAAIASILATRLINYSLHYAENNSISSEIIERLQVLIKEEGAFTNDLKYVIAKKIVNGNKTKFAKLLVDATVQELIMK